MGAAQLSSKLPARGAPARNPPAPWTTPPFSAPPATCDACIAGHALGSFVAHPPKSPTFLLWTLFSLLFLYSPLGKIQLSNANFSPRFYIFFFLFYFTFFFHFFVLLVSASNVFLFQPKASQDELSAYQHLFAVDLCSMPPPYFQPPLGCSLSQTIDIHIHIHTHVHIQSAVEYLPSMLIEFFPVD